jgi:hypothetical protein
VATGEGWGTTERYSLGARQPNGAPVAVKEDTAAVTKLLLVCLVTKSGKEIVGLLVGEEEKQTQELAMDTRLVSLLVKRQREPRHGGKLPELRRVAVARHKYELKVAARGLDRLVRLGPDVDMHGKKATCRLR